MSKENAFPAVSVPAHWHSLALIVHVVAARPSAGDETLNQMTSTVATSSFAIFATQKVEGPPNGWVGGWGWGVNIFIRYRGVGVENLLEKWWTRNNMYGKHCALRIPSLTYFSNFCLLCKHFDVRTISAIMN